MNESAALEACRRLISCLGAAAKKIAVCPTPYDGQKAFSLYNPVAGSAGSAGSPLVVSLANPVDHVFWLMRRPLRTLQEVV